MSYRRVNGVTRWFHTVDVTGTSPAMSVMDFNDAFLDMCEAQGLSLYVTEQTFRRRMCEFVCTLYLAKLHGNCPVAGPHTPPPLPEDWTRDMQEHWLDALQHFYFSSQDWEQFWKGVPVSPWEESLPTWRADIQAVAILYIRGDTDRLLQTGTLYKEDGGHLVADEYDGGSSGRDAFL